MYVAATADPNKIWGNWIKICINATLEMKELLEGESKKKKKLQFLERLQFEIIVN